MSLKTSWFIKGRRAQSVDDYETWNEGGVVPTLNLGDNTGDTRATVLIFYGNRVDDIRIQGDVINTLQARMGTGGGNDQVLIVEDDRRTGPRLHTEIAPTLQSFMGTGGGNVPMVFPIQDGREIEKSQNGLGVGAEGAPAYTIDTHATQAVAIQGNMIGRADTAGPQGKGYTEEGEPMFTLTKTDVHAVAGSTVRRLTPMECERLQGFPEIKKCATFILCLDHQKNPALAGIQNLKWQRFVGSAGNDRLNEIAWSAVNDLSSKNLQISEPAQILVRINYEAKRVEILSLGKLLWSANNAESQNLLALPIKTGDFVQVNVGLMQIAEQITIGGEVELRQNAEKTLIGVTHGNYAEKQFGNETKPSANAVNSSLTEPLSDTMFTTLPLTDLQSLEQNLQTLFCFVKPVIDGFIPTQTDQKSLLTFQIESVEGWTDGQTDGHRYKQMGNAVAVPVVDWIVKRLLHPSL